MNMKFHAVAKFRDSVKYQEKENFQFVHGLRSARVSESLSA